MGIDIGKKIIVGTAFGTDEIADDLRDSVDVYVTDPKNNVSNVTLKQINPYGTEKNLPDFILGIIKESLPGDAERHQKGEKLEKSSIEVLNTAVTEEDKQAITKVMDNFGLDKNTHPIKTYKVIYFW